MARDQLDMSTGGTVITPAATLANGSRKEWDFDNSASGKRDTRALVFLSLHYDSSAPSVGTVVAELSVLPGDDQGTPVYPEGGDGTGGADVDPQTSLGRYVFETRSPSTSVDEVLVADVKIWQKNRMVLKNTTGSQSINSGYTIRIVPYTHESVS